MRLQRFIRNLTNLLRLSPQRSAPARLRLRQLEDRRLLNATLGLDGIVLDNAASLTVSEGPDVDFGSGTVSTVSLSIGQGSWSVNDIT
ncbi:MAG: hypothetical protein ACO3FE_22405, partial [Planctomycetaceae bacterium]